MKGLNLALSSYEDIFKDNTSRNYEDVSELDIEKLIPYENQPFKVLLDDNMNELVDSIKESGVLNPIIVRPLNNDTYEILSGHRRTKACELAGIQKIPAIIKNLDDDTASILLVDSNLYRETILPSEKAYAYKLKLEAMKHKAGRRASGNLVQIGQNSRKELSEQTGESSVQIQRYIRLTNLVQQLLDMVDNKKLALNAAVELSYLPKDYQDMIAEHISECGKYPSIKQASELRKTAQEGTFDIEIINEIMLPKKAIKKSNDEKTLSKSELIAMMNEPWSNNTCRGYIIYAMENCGFAPEDIRRVVQELRYVFDFKSLDEAKKHYENGTY